MAILAKVRMQPHLSVVFSRRAQRSEVLRVTESGTIDFHNEVIKNMLNRVGHFFVMI